MVKFVQLDLSDIQLNEKIKRELGLVSKEKLLEYVQQKYFIPADFLNVILDFTQSHSTCLATDTDIQISTILAQIEEQVKKEWSDYLHGEDRVTSLVKFLLSVVDIVILDNQFLLYNVESKRWVSDDQALKRIIYELSVYFGMDRNKQQKTEASVLFLLQRTCERIFLDDLDRRYLCLENVALDRSNGKITQLSKENISFLYSPIIYNEESDCPLFKQFLSDVFEDDVETIAFVQQWFGYVLSKDHSANVFLLGYGTGANGKSVLFNILSQLVGIRNVSSATLDAFGTPFGLEILQDKMLNVATESGVNYFATNQLKAITAGESIVVNRKGKVELETKLDLKLVYLMNQLPLITDTSHGFFRRVLVLPFHRVFTPKEQDPKLMEKLMSEIGGIFNWALEGLRIYNANGYKLAESKCMVKAKANFLDESSPVDSFVKNKVKANPFESIEGNTLMSMYQDYVINNNWSLCNTDNPKVFWKLFDRAMSAKSMRYTKKKSNGATKVFGIKVDGSEDCENE